VYVALAGQSVLGKQRPHLLIKIPPLWIFRTTAIVITTTTAAATQRRLLHMSRRYLYDDYYDCNDLVHAASTYSIYYTCYLQATLQPSKVDLGWYIKWYKVYFVLSICNIYNWHVTMICPVPPSSSYPFHPYPFSSFPTRRWCHRRWLWWCRALATRKRPCGHGRL
jgi:hypothetical protein